MKRKSERGKTKPEAKEESPEKTTRKSHRHTRRRRKSSSSSEETNQTSLKEVENTSPPLNIEVQNIELPQGEKPEPVATNNSEEMPTKSDEAEKEWKEDSAFWQTDAPELPQDGTATESTKDKEENSMWKVQSANGAGGEIQKLKICRQRPTDSPESGDAALRKRLNQGARDSRSTDDSAHEESEKDTRKPKHRTRTSSRNSPMISPTVVCDMSEGSPTKIKIINVSHINSSNKGGNISKSLNDETTKEDNQESGNEQTKKDDPIGDIALPSEEPPQKPSEGESVEVIQVNVEESPPDKLAIITSNVTLDDASISDKKQTEIGLEDGSSKLSPKKSSSTSSSPKKDAAKSPSIKSSRSDTEASGDDESKPRKVKKKRRRELQSTVQRKQESSDSEDEKQKKEDGARRGSTDTQDTKEIANGKENNAELPLLNKDNDIEENKEKEDQTSCPMPRKRRWGSSKANRRSKKQTISISTDSLKSIIPDAKPVPAEELQLSVEEEEGQLDDDEEEDEVVALVAKEEEKQLERERQKEERQREREKELEERRKRQERLERSKPDQPPEAVNNKGSSSRKILLLTDDAKKLARSPSPPRHKPTSVLYITHLVRPFTVQQLRNLLLRTGTIAENGFWIDKIKSKCYVEYTTEDAAVETRHALHGVRWPTSNPKTLLVEFASHEDLLMAQALSEEPDVPRKSEPLNMVEGWVADQARIKERNRRAIIREWDVGKPEHPDEVLEFDLKVKEKKEQERKSRKDRHHRSATPEAEPPARKSRRKEEDAPAKLLDDLFRKTKTSPCIYWLPLTPEQISVKEEIRRQHMAEHERRMAELKKVEQARRDRERRNRK